MTAATKALKHFILAFGLLSIPFLGCGPLGPVSSPNPIIASLSHGRLPLQYPAAHRGIQVHSQENTIGAISDAIELKVPLVELDIRRAKDNTLFLFHDRVLRERLVSGPAHVLGRDAESLTAQEITTIRLTPRGESVPLLRSALELVKGKPVALLLDLKGESKNLIDRVMNEVKLTGAEHFVIIQCQALASVVYLRLFYPFQAILYRAHEPYDAAHSFPHRPDIIQIDYEWASQELIQRIHEHGSRVLVKTLSPQLDSPQVWRSLFERGVDIILTDKAQEILADSKGHETPV